MEFCPVCKSTLETKVESCPVCNQKLDEKTFDEWVTLGFIEDKLSADYAQETFKSYEIPIVIFSKSGFFGNSGLPLNPFYNNVSALFEIRVPGEFKEEAADLLTVILGNKWQQEETN